MLEESLYTSFKDLSLRKYFVKNFKLSYRVQRYKEILEVLRKIHTQNPPIVHEDLKPENIMASTQFYERFKLIDFEFTDTSIKPLLAEVLG
jgi:serine/threonine protein kinase